MKGKNFKNVILWITYTVFLLFLMLNFKTVWSIFCDTISILRPILYGFVLAYLLNLPFNIFKNKLFKNLGNKCKPLEKLKTPLSIILSYILFAGFVTGLVAVLIPALTQSAEILVDSLPVYIAQVEDKLDDLVDYIYINYNINFNEGKTIELYTDKLLSLISSDNISKLIDTITGNIFPAAITTVKFLALEVYNWIVAIIISIYLLLSKDKLILQLKKIVTAYFKPNDKDKIFKVAHLMNNKCGKFIVGKIIDSFAVGILCFIGMSILKFDYALLISFVIGIANIIPFFGPFIGAIPSAFLLLIINPIQCFWFVIFILILQQIDGHILEPLILGDQIGLSGFWIIFCVILGGGLFGIVGMLLGVPVFAVIYSLVGENVNNKINKNQVQNITDTKNNDEN